MIQLKRSKSGSYELSDRKLTVELNGKKINLADYPIDQPGEFEQGGVEVVYSTNAALIVWEYLQIVYVFRTNKPDQFEKNQFSSADVLLLDENLSELTKDVLSALTDVYNPRAIIFGEKTPIEPTYKATLKVVEQSPVKLAAQTLPMEGRDYIVLP